MNENGHAARPNRVFFDRELKKHLEKVIETPNVERERVAQDHQAEEYKRGDHAEFPPHAHVERNQIASRADHDQNETVDGNHNKQKVNNIAHFRKLL